MTVSAGNKRATDGSLFETRARIMKDWDLNRKPGNTLIRP